MRIVTWNMGLADRRRRFVAKHDAAWRYLLNLDPDVAFLQEALPPPWIADVGMVVRDPYRKWGSLIFSRNLAIDGLTLPNEHSLRLFPNYLAFAEHPSPTGERLLLVSVHARPRPAGGVILDGRDPAMLRRSVEGPMYNDIIFAELVPLVHDRRFIVAGDWNTARRQGTERKSQAGELFFSRTRDAGWYDCAWETLGDEVRTWFGPGRLQQDDYVFCDRMTGMKTREVTVAKGAAEESNLSDHAPLIVDIRGT